MDNCDSWEDIYISKEFIMNYLKTNRNAKIIQESEKDVLVEYHWTTYVQKIRYIFKQSS